MARLGLMPKLMLISSPASAARATVKRVGFVAGLGVVFVGVLLKLLLMARLAFVCLQRVLGLLILLNGSEFKRSIPSPSSIIMVKSCRSGGKMFGGRRQDRCHGLEMKSFSFPWVGDI